MHKLLLIGIAGMLLAACTGTEQAEPVPRELSEPAGTPALEQIEMGLEDAVTPDEISADITELRESGVSGTVRLTETQGEQQTRVVITLDQAQTAGALPAAVHLGDCAVPGTVLHTLQSVENGTSTTMLPTGLQPLLDSADELAVLLSQSEQTADAYVACAEID